MLNDLPKSQQGLPWIRDQLLKAHLLVVCPQASPLLPPFAHDPLPIQSRDPKSFVAVPRQRIGPTLLDIGKSNIAAVTNNVDEQRIRYLTLDLLHVQKMVWGTVCPASSSLLACNILHHDSQEISSTAAFGHYLVTDFTSIQSRDSKWLTSQPYFQKLFPVRCRTHSAKSR